MVIVDVRATGGRGDVGIPTDAYFAVEEIKDDGTATQRSFAHIPSVIEAEEAEEIGVEHLLRDIKTPHQFGTLSNRVAGQIASLRGLHSRLIEIRDYLALVLKGKLAVNHQIMYNLQDIFNLLPDLDGANRASSDKRRAFRVETNDQLLVIYLSSLIRSVLALHDLSEFRIARKRLIGSPTRIAGSLSWLVAKKIETDRVCFAPISPLYRSREPDIKFVSTHFFLSNGVARTRRKNSSCSTLYNVVISGGSAFGGAFARLLIAHAQRGV